MSEGLRNNKTCNFVSKGAFHSVKISEISGHKSNRTGKVPGRIPEHLWIYTFWVNPIFRKIGITGKFCSIRLFLLEPSFSEAWIDIVNMAATPATQQICPLVVMFCHWHSPLSHRMNRPDRSTAACDTRFRTQSTLLSVISNLVATARVCSCHILRRKAYKTCLVGGIGASPDPLPSFIIWPVRPRSRNPIENYKESWRV